MKLVVAARLCVDILIPTWSTRVVIYYCIEAEKLCHFECNVFSYPNKLLLLLFRGALAIGKSVVGVVAAFVIVVVVVFIVVIGVDAQTSSLVVQTIVLNPE